MSGDNIKVSVIVPIYNAQQLLQRCLNSLVQQTETSIEIILVNDGSNDNSENICLEFKKIYANIHYYSQLNSGVAAARNYGITKAKGEYLMFADSDDYYEVDAIEKLIKAAIQNSADIVIGSVRKLVFGKEIITSAGNIIVTHGDNRKKFINLIVDNYMINQMWGKLYNFEIIKNNQINLDETLTSGEDLDWLCRVVSHGNTLMSISDVTYNYVIENETSLSQKFSKDYFCRIDKTFKSLQNLGINENLGGTFMEKLINRQLDNYWNGFLKINSKNCDIGFKEKVQYVKSALNSENYKMCLSKVKGNYISKLKLLIMRIKSPVIVVIFASLIKLKNVK